MDIAIETIGSWKAYQLACHTGTRSKERCCAQHGYRFHQQTTLLDPTRRHTWSKILLTKAILSSSDWVLWLNPDIPLMDLSRPLTDCIDTDYSFILCEEVIGGVNAGVFLIRNTPLMHQFLDEIYAKKYWDENPHSDQAALRKVLDTYPQYREATKILPQKELHPFAPEAVLHETTAFLPGTYTEGDFLVHFPSIRDPMKLSFLMLKYTMSARKFHLFATFLEKLASLITLFHPRGKKASLCFREKKGARR